MSVLVAALAFLYRLQAAYGKGCFLGATPVSMADGTEKPLNQIEVGDEVLSWDEDGQHLAPSVVMHIPTFSRVVTEMVVFSLPHAAIYTTEDHPLWSRGRRMLVSMSPNATVAEYGLQAEVVQAGEELESRDLQSVRVLDITRLTAELPLEHGRAFTELDFDGKNVAVTTLCLHPFHWFYVHGVRVHNKGCFVGSTEVTMADGTRRPLEELRVGHEVLSWDDAAQIVTKSAVMGIPRFQRSAESIVDIKLPHAEIHATNDHPFWSRGRGALVSSSPFETAKEYGLEAMAMQVGEELESEDMQSVPVVDITHHQSFDTWPIGSNFPNESLVSGQVEVTTLCLHPFHWFYVHGVRVHNKGCFAPWVRVLMSDGSQKPISEVIEQDRVVSWDSDREHLSEATVIGVDVFPAGELYEIAYHSPQNASPSAANSGLESHRGSLVLTADHPVYSSRQQGLVSMRPTQTHESYGLAASQMQEHEIVSHYSGSDVEVRVQPWLGENASVVMTLRLDSHHWFYAGGVRVHNKGFGGGGHFGGHYGGSRGHPFATKRWTSHTGMPAHTFAALVVLSYRRRYGTWYNDPNDDCRINEIYAAKPMDGPGAVIAADGPKFQPVNATQQLGVHLNGTAALDSLCAKTVSSTSGGVYASCSACNACQDAACTQSIVGCQQFLSEVYTECARYAHGSPLVSVIVTFGAGFCVLVTAFCLCTYQKPHDMMASTREERQQMTGANAPGIGVIQFNGTYKERGEEKPTAYDFRIDEAGVLMGTGRDDDGEAQVEGIMRWDSGDVGKIMWCESRPGVSMEVNGRIALSGGGPGMYEISAKYLSSTGVMGELRLRAQGSSERSPLL